MPKPKQLTLTLSVKQTDNEHHVEPADVRRAMQHIVPLINAGATGGIIELYVPHSHMGESDTACYEVEWSIVSA